MSLESLEDFPETVLLGGHGALEVRFRRVAACLLRLLMLNAPSVFFFFFFSSYPRAFDSHEPKLLLPNESRPAWGESIQQGW